jgi:hypothetical protein
MGKIHEGQSFGDLIPAMEFTDHTLQRTSNWKLIRGRARRENTPRQDDGPVCSLRCPEGGSNENIVPAVKNKPKTRGKAPTTHFPLDQAQTQAKEKQSLAEQSIFWLKERDLKVFHCLFYQPLNEDALAKIKWLDFVHAMSSVGVTYQKLGGSAWQFTPPAQWATRGISFHEPHPATRVPFFLARQMVRRPETRLWVG